jgi:hypothetical protein
MIVTDLKRGFLALTCACLIGALLPASAAAQAADPNPGALTFTGAFDVPSLYLFRGIRQESDPSLTMWPYADLKIDLMSGDGAVKSAAVNFGVWNSLHTGTSGTDVADGRLHYEEDFYAALTLGFGGATSLTSQYTAYTSPNARFTTVKEVSFKVAQASKYAPYGLVAFEFDTEPGLHQADGGLDAGTYLELGIGPSWPLGGSTTIAVPVKLGMSLNDYYELAGEDNKFGYFDIGALVTVPLTGIPSRFGSWNVHFGGDYFALGDTTEALNVNSEGETSKHKVVGLFGFGVTY